MFIWLDLITEGLPNNISTKITNCNNKQTNGGILLRETSIEAKIQLTDLLYAQSAVFMAVSNKTIIATCYSVTDFSVS